MQQLHPTTRKVDKSRRIFISGGRTGGGGAGDKLQTYDQSLNGAVVDGLLQVNWTETNWNHDGTDIASCWKALYINDRHTAGGKLYLELDSPLYRLHPE